MKADFVEPNSFIEASQFLAQYGGDAKIIAGGTAVVLMLNQRLIAPAVLVSLGQVAENKAIRKGPDGLHIGALTLLSEAEHSETLQQFCPALAHAFGVVGNVRIRNQATVGGNLAEADYASDPPAMLSALNAHVKVINPNGEREILLSEFFQGFYTTALEPDEIVTEVVVPNLPNNARSTYMKYTSRSAEDRPCVGVAAVVDLDEDGQCNDLRLAVGAAVETPQRIADVERQAKGEKLTDELIEFIAEEYAQELDPLEDARGSAWYRREMIRVFIRRALMEVRDGNR